MNFPWDNDTMGVKIFDRHPSQEFKYQIKNYPDGSKYVILEQWGPQLIFRLNEYEDLWILGQINDILKRNKLTTQLVIPNLIDAQADRRFKENQPHSLKLACKFLNELTQFEKITIFHPHNPEVVEVLIDNVEIMDNSEFVDRILSYKLKGVDKENLILMSSDAGGFKPLMKMADKIKWRGETYSASKSRKYEDGHSKLTQIVDRQDFGGKDILIVDDLCIYGGTFKGLAKLLKEKNCGNLYLAVSHLTVENLGQDPVTDYFTKIFTTNSKFDVYYGRDDFEPRNLEVIDLF